MPSHSYGGFELHTRWNFESVLRFKDLTRSYVASSLLEVLLLYHI